MKMHNKYNRFQKFYKAIYPKLRPKFILELSKILDLASSTIYQKIKENSFNAEERAKLAYHLGIPQNILFPDLPEDVVVSEKYKANFEPLYKNLFIENGYEYNPEEIIHFLLSETYYIIE